MGFKIMIDYTQFHNYGISESPLSAHALKVLYPECYNCQSKPSISLHRSSTFPVIAISKPLKFYAETSYASGPLTLQGKSSPVP